MSKAYQLKAIEVNSGIECTNLCIISNPKKTIEEVKALTPKLIGQRRKLKWKGYVCPKTKKIQFTSFAGKFLLVISSANSERPIIPFIKREIEGRRPTEDKFKPNPDKYRHIMFVLKDKVLYWNPVAGKWHSTKTAIPVSISQEMFNAVKAKFGKNVVMTDYCKTDEYLKIVN